MGRRKIRTPRIIVAVLLVSAFSFNSSGNEATDIKLHGFVTMEGGQFVNYKYQSQDFLHRWSQQNLLGLGIEANLNPRLNLYMMGVGILYYNVMPDTALQRPTDNILAPLGGYIVDRAEMVVDVSPDPESIGLKIGIGMFPYKYNDESRNLGEYLFRSGCYPGYINQDGFDWPVARLAGIRWETNLFGLWHNDVMLTSELYWPPFNDFSLAYVTSISDPNKIIDFGAGVQFFRLFSVAEELTTPTWAKRGGTGTIAPNYYLDSLGIDPGTGLPKV